MATQDLDPQHEEDNLKFAVNASEDEFLDEEGQEGESQSDLSIQESNDEQSDSDRSGSVVIAPINQEELQKQQ